MMKYERWIFLFIFAMMAIFNGIIVGREDMLLGFTFGIAILMPGIIIQYVINSMPR